MILAIASVLAVPSGASAGFLTSVGTSLSSTTLTSRTCPAVVPVVHAMSLAVPSAGSGAACTNDTQCTGAGEACVFSGSVLDGGVCSASGILSRGDIHYVAGTLVDVEVTIPDCTTVSHVNGVPLGGYSGIDAQAAPVSWTFLPSGPPTTVNGQTALRQRLRVTMPNAGDGTTGGITVQVTARTGGAIATRSVTVAQVAAVNAAMRTTIAERSIRNSYVASVYEQFGDYDQVWTEDGTRAYGVNWSELVTLANDRHAGTDMRIENGRIVFSMQFKADKPGCDPNVWVEGSFRFVPATDSVLLQWIRPPEARADASGVCGPLTFGIYDLFVDGFADEAEIAAPFAEKIASGVGADANGLIKVCTACRVVDAKIGDGRIEFWTIPPSPRVRVHVRAARGTDVTANPSLGMIIPAGFRAPIAGAGTLETCVAPDGIPGSCDSFVTDMDGAFNWWGNDVPVPDSIVYNEYGTATVLGGRSNALDRLKGVLRRTAEMPAPIFAADALIARRTQPDALSTTTRVLAKNGCALPASVAAYRIAIGINETPYAPPVRGKLEATVLIAPDKGNSDVLFGSLPTCPAVPAAGASRVTTTGTLGSF